MIGSAVLFSVMGMLIRHAEGVSFYVMALIRFTIGACLLGTLALFGKIRLQFNNSPVLFLRGLLGGVAVVTFYLSIVKIGLAKGTIVSYTYPVFATLGGIIVLKDRVRALVWLPMGLAMLGLALLTRSSWSHGFTGEGDLWMALTFAGAVLAGAAIVCVKRLTATDSSSATFISQCLIGFWIVLVPATLGSARIALSTVLILIGIGLLATVAQLLMTWSFAYVTIASGSLLSLLTPTLNVVLGVFLFRESLTVLEAIGTGLILISCLGVAVFGREPIAVRH
jgi:drug/metabolite transporter (DMT)-like permease